MVSHNVCIYGGFWVIIKIIIEKGKFIKAEIMPDTYDVIKSVSSFSSRVLYILIAEKE